MQRPLTFALAAARLQALVSQCVRGEADDDEYRRTLEATSSCVHRPTWVDAYPTPWEMRQFLQRGRPHYAERDAFIADELDTWVQHAQGGPCHADLSGLDGKLENLGAEAVLDHLKTAERRLVDDPSGAFTMARTMLEAACKHVWRRHNPEDQSDLDNLGMNELVKKALSCISKERPATEHEVLGHVSAGVNELAWAFSKGRKTWGDGHDKKVIGERPPPHLAECLVHLSAATAIFLLRCSPHRS